MPTDEGSAPLTDKQLEVLNAALEHGYYECPRETQLKELADEIGISHQALSERMRRANKQLALAALKSQSDSGSLWVGRSLTNSERVHKHPNCPKLASTTPKSVNEREVEWHNLDSCPHCAGTRNLLFQTNAAHRGAD